MCNEKVKISGDSKQTLRKVLLEYRKNLSADEVKAKSNCIIDKILATEAYKNTECIYAYISTRNEVELRALIETALESRKRVAVPRVCGEDMDFYYITGYENLVKGKFGILEPAESAVKAEETDALMLIPGVAYDRQCNRIGYGGGYYDRYLAKKNMHYIIAPAYEFQIVESISAEEHDFRVNEIISEA